MRIDSVLMLCGPQITDFIECVGGLGNLLVMRKPVFQPRRHSRQPHPDAEGMPAAQGVQAARGGAERGGV
jgi:hypothetical protein